MPLRQHQHELIAICDRILAGEPITRILCGVTPGGGKSLLPQILASKLLPAIADRVCWIVPRSALQDQGARGFQDPAQRNLIQHTLEAMVSTNEHNPTRGHSTYVTTYQAVAADKNGVNAKEFRTRRYILVLDEPHHIEESGLWHEALQPLYDQAALVVLMSGTFERGDGNPIAFVPYVYLDDGVAIDWQATETQAVIRYGLREAWRERAVIDLEVHYVDCQAQWAKHGVQYDVPSLAQAEDLTAPALYTALHSDAALQLLEMGVAGWRSVKQRNPRSKLLVVAATIEQATRYTAWLREHSLRAEIATSDDSASAHRAIQTFKRTGPSGLDILVTVAMAYEGLDVPAVTHLICLTHIRTKPWIEQVIHRATRVDYAAGPYAQQQAHIYAPDDHHFRACVAYLLVERDQFRACAPASTAGPKGDGLAEVFGGGQGMYPEITVLGSSVVGVREDACMQRIRDLARPPSFDEIIETPADRIARLRKQIEAHCRRYERRRQLPHGTVNRELFSVFRKSRSAMTEPELGTVLHRLEAKYV